MRAVTRTLTGAALVAALTALALPQASAGPAAPRTERFTVSATGEQGNGGGSGDAISADGRYIVFSSWASNLVPGDTNEREDVFLRDLHTHTVKRVSVASDGAQGDASSARGALSADGRYVVFSSQARNFTTYPSPPAEWWGSDVYVHDTRTGRTDRISHTVDGMPAYANGAVDIAADGRYVAFAARKGTMETTDKGIYLAVYVTDRRSGETVRASKREGARLRSTYSLDMSADGSRIAYGFTEPKGPVADVHVTDWRTGKHQQVNVKPDGTPSAGRSDSRPSLSADGRKVAFTSGATDLVGGPPAEGFGYVYVRDLRTGTTSRVEGTLPGSDGGTEGGVLSPDGRYLGYQKAATKEEPGQPRVVNAYVRDLRTGKVELVSPSTTGGPVTDADVWVTGFDAARRSVVLGGRSAQLVPDDTNGESDGFVRRLH